MARFYDNIDAPLVEELMNPGSLRDFDWLQITKDVRLFQQEHRMQQELHERMQPFYWEYIYAEDNYTQGLYQKRLFVQDVFRADALAGEWAHDEVDICEMTERWMLYGNEDEFKNLLKALVHVRYYTAWDEVLGKINEVLRRLEVEGSRKGDANAGAFYCQLHGYSMIASSELEHSRKADLIELFVRHWDYLRYIYSVMLRRIVGCGFTNFVSVANNVANTAAYEPYLHLFYAPLQERFDDLCQKGTKQEKLMKSQVRLTEKIESSTPSDELDELCEILFPDEFREMLNRHRPKSYRELENEVDRIKQEMQSTVEALNSQIHDLAQQLSAAVKASVPIADIEKELMKFQSREALSIYMQLNVLLVGNEAWLSNSLRIRDAILSRQQQELQLSMHITAQPGSSVNGVVQKQDNFGIDSNRQIPA